MDGIIISIVNNKGGVGKTTTAVNLAHSLTRCNKRVLIVDMDSQCNATTLLLPNGVKRYTMYEFFDLEGPDIQPERCIYATPYENLFCLPNSEDTGSLEPNLMGELPRSFMIFRNKIREFVKQRYDFTLIDNPPNMGFFVVSSLYASDFVIVPNEAGSSFSIEGLLKAIRLINDIREKGNQDLRFLRLLITQIDRRLSMSKITINDIRENFEPNQIFKTTIPTNTAFQKAESFRQTILRYDSRTPGAKAYRSLANEIIDIFENSKGDTHG